MVEAAGVEPASENVTGRESTYLVNVHATGVTPPPSQPMLRTDKKHSLLARKSRPENPGVVSRTSPLVDVLPQPADTATEDGYLTN